MGVAIALRGYLVALCILCIPGHGGGWAFDLRNPGGPPPFHLHAPGSENWTAPDPGTSTNSVPARPGGAMGVVILPDGGIWPGPTIIVPRRPPVSQNSSAWPVHALPPPDWRMLLIPPPGAEKLREIRLPGGMFWTLGTPIRGDEAIFAKDCWAVPPEEPGQTPSNFDGRIVLPDGRRWIPGSALSPQWPVWAWMCSAWMALRLRFP